MSTLLESIFDIRNALEKNKLIVFVGAGVSANSKYPTWNDLVKKFAKELDIRQTTFSSDELLKIPQYMFEHNSERYYQIISETMGINVNSNSINEMILEILPNHIITTNYDKLLESVSNINVNSYKVVSNDSELLSTPNDHYIIKMHGDIDNIEQIVLKEDDYLNYSSNRILTETYIKSLLVDHTFLFVGYSLNDYNLKIIMSWIEFLSTKENVKDIRHKNFIFQTKQVEGYEKEYWSNKNLKIIEGTEISNDLLEKYPSDSITHEDGKKLYTFLRIIQEENAELDLTDLLSVMVERYKVFQDVAFIYVYDLLDISGIKNYTLQNQTLVLYDEEIFLKWEELLKEKDIVRYWEKSSIQKIVLRLDKREIEIKLNEGIQKERNIIQELISFNYNQVINQINVKNFEKKREFYYKALLSSYSSEVESYFTRDLYSVKESLSTWEIIVEKYNNFLYRKMIMPYERQINDSTKYISLSSNYEKKAYKYLYTLIQEGKDYKLFEKASNSLVRVENTYNNPPAFTTEPYGELYKIQNYVYEHFMYIKLNGILVDHFDETLSLFEFYNKALIISQTVIKNHPMDFGFGTQPSIINYQWEHLDIYIFVYYGNHKNLQGYIENNNIQNISIHKNIDIVELFTNYCNSLLYTLDLGNFDLAKKLKNFILILSNTKLTMEQKEKLKIPILNLLNNQKFIKNLENSSESKHFMDLVQLIIYKDIEINVLDFILLLYNVPLEAFSNQYILKFVSSVKKSNGKFKTNNFEKCINNIMSVRPNDSAKLLWIENLFLILSKDFLKEHLYFLIENLSQINIDLVIHLNNLELLEPDTVQKLKDTYYKKITKAHELQKKGISSTPNPIETSISECILLNIYECFDDLLFLKDKIELSDHLDFILNPSDFNYSKIEPRNYMWKNLFRQKKYLKNILKYGKEELNEIIKNNIKLGVASEAEKKIFYKYLVEDEEMWMISEL